MTFDIFIYLRKYQWSRKPSTKQVHWLVTASYKMICQNTLHKAKSVLFINGHYYSKFGFYRDITNKKLSLTLVETHVWKLTFVEGTPYIRVMFVNFKQRFACETCRVTLIRQGPSVFLKGVDIFFYTIAIYGKKQCIVLVLNSHWGRFFRGQLARPLVDRGIGIFNFSENINEWAHISWNEKLQHPNIQCDLFKAQNLIFTLWQLMKISYWCSEITATKAENSYA